MSAFFDFGLLTCSPKHSNFVRGWIVVVMIVNYPYIISLTKSFRCESAVMNSTLTLKQKVPALLRGLMLVGLPTLSSRTAALLEYPRQWQR